jgi:hypothetical protein
MNLNNEYYYQHYERQLISKYEYNIKQQLKTVANNMCYNDIPLKYLNSAIKHFDYGYIYRDTTNNDNLVGFVIWDIKSFPNFNKTVYIRLMCGRGLGKLMMEDVEEWALRQNIHTITLIPANERLQHLYTIKYGFKPNANIYFKSISQEVIELVSPARQHSINNKRKTRKKKINKKKNNNINNFITSAKTHKIINLNSLK